jgi:hypothetical protein
MAAFFVFDLDETLANVYTPFYFLGDLKPDVFIKDADMHRVKNSPELAATLENAYRIFVRKVALAEIQETPLGILRPGILDIMHQIKRWRMEGLDARIAIYSNNGHLLMLQFARDVIETAIGAPGMICDCIYWGDKRRAAEIEKNKPGYAQKTIAVLLQALKDGPCAAPADLTAEQIMFFDDQLHPDMMAALTWRYIQVKPHSYRVPVHLIRELYMEALREAGIIEGVTLEKEFRNASAAMWGKNNMPFKNTLASHATQLANLTQRGSSFAKGLLRYDQHETTREVYPILQRMNMFVESLSTRNQGAAAAAESAAVVELNAATAPRLTHDAEAEKNNTQVGGVGVRRSNKRRTRKSPRRGRR